MKQTPTWQTLVLYADFAQVVLLDSGLDLDVLQHEAPFWDDPNEKTFSSRAENRAVALATDIKGAVLLHVLFDQTPEAHAWIRETVFDLHVPTGCLTIAEILTLETPLHAIKMPAGQYRMQAFFGAVEERVDVPENALCLTEDRNVQQQICLKLERV